MRDPYIQENGTLKNRLGITSYNDLREAEKDISYVKIMNVDQVFEGEFDMQLLKNIHKHIFEDVYDWAGEFRKIPLFKEELIIPRISLIYAEPKDIQKGLQSTYLKFGECIPLEMVIQEVL